MWETFVEQSLGREGFRERDVLCGTDVTCAALSACAANLSEERDLCEMANISAEKHERIRCRADESADMSDRVTGDVEDIYAAVSEIVPSVEFSDLEIERCFDDIAVFEVGFPENRFLFGWISRQESVSEPRTDDHID